jgi:hypothetical protein
MATKYDLPQFRTPTQQYRRMPIIRTPNYGEIYAKSFLAGQQMGQATFAPIIAALEKKAKEKKAIEKTTDTFDAQLDISIERAFEGTGNADQKSRKLFSKKADMLAEAKKQALLNPNKKAEYELAFKTFKDDLRNWGATSEKLKNLTTILEGDTKMELSNFQNNSFILALKDELIENKGQGLNFRLNEELKDEMFFKDEYGQDVVISTEFLANTDLASLLETKADFSAKGAEGQLFQTLAEEFNQSGAIPSPTAQTEAVNVKPGVSVTTAGKTYTAAEKTQIKDTLLADKKFQEIYGDGSIAKSKFVHDWILTDNSTETLSIAREKIKAIAEKSGIELNDFSDQMIETLLFTYGIDNENMLAEEEALMGAVNQYINGQIADYFYKKNYEPNEIQEFKNVDIEPVTTEDNSKLIQAGSGLALLSNFETNGGVLDQIQKFHNLVEGMGTYIDNETGAPVYGGKGRLTEYAIEQFGIDIPAANKFSEIGPKRVTGLADDSGDDIGVHDEYQYYLGDTFVSSTDDIYESAYNFFKLKGSDFTKNQVKKLLTLYNKKTEGFVTPKEIKEYNDYINELKEIEKEKFIKAGGNPDKFISLLNENSFDQYVVS